MFRHYSLTDAHSRTAARSRVGDARGWVRIALVAAAVAVASGCGSSTEPLQAPSLRLEALTPLSLRGPVGTAATPAPTVRVTDGNAKPVRGAHVFFEFAAGSSGSGGVQTVGVSTDANGTATVEWILCTKAGPCTVIARMGGAAELVFAATAEPGPVAQMTALVDAQRGLAGATLPSPPSVAVADRFENAVPGVTVSFNVISGGGSIDPDTAVTNSSGIATPGQWTLGSAIGEQRLRAAAAGAEVILTAQAVTEDECGLACAAGARLAFVRDGQVWLVNLDGSGLMQLTSTGFNSEPAWSPDGRRIAFVSDRDGGSDIYVMNADGSGAVRRTNTGRNHSPAWSPDGRRIAFSSLRDGQNGIYVMRVDEDWWNVAHLGFDRGFNAYPAWSPDGRRIAFVSDSRAFDFVYDVYVMNADGSDVKPVLQGPLFSVDGPIAYFQPAWSPDGGTIAVAACPHAWDNCYPNSTIALVNPDGSGLRAIANGGGFARPTWSPDGSTIAFAASSCRSCASSIHIVTADGSQTSLIVSDGHSPAWRP